jgi:hypothetical protein
MAVARSGVMAAAGADELLLGPGGVLLGAEWLPLHATRRVLRPASAANLAKAAVRVTCVLLPHPDRDWSQPGRCE